ncbi:FO synthase [Gordonia polyisoprenivorans]|uniref:FO synthase n=1 Tax=Gordonia polyisoprenivorans TaxID=84595 RepID=UPI00035E67C5|nr:FO synthase [Gordonia polyisoprenivorans]
MVLRAWATDHRAPVERVAAALERLSAAPVGTPADLSDDEWIALLGADGDLLDELCAHADAARRAVTDPEALTYVVNRNLDTAVAASLTTDPSLEDLVVEAHGLGATEICMQGPLPADAPAEGYLRLIERITAAAPVHLHAFRPPEIRDAAARLGIDVEEFLRRARGAGLGSVPGTAAQILDDEVRAVLAPPGTEYTRDGWIEVISAAHEAGLFSTATVLYGHVETPGHVLAHLRTLCGIQSRTGGFSELILMPMVADNTPPHLRSVAVASASRRETRAIHAVTRLVTLGRFDHIQVAWTKLDADVVDEVLRGGVDDIGGMLLDGTMMPSAGPEAGRVLDAERLAGFAERAGRTPVQRTTAYRQPGDRPILHRAGR